MRWGVVVLGMFTGFAVLGVLGGCGFSSPSARSTDACETFASQFNTCMLTFDGDLMLSGTITYDTAMHELKVDGAMMPVMHMTLGAGTGDVDAIFAHNVRLTAGAQLRATGTLPFAIVASGAVTLEDGATIDVSNGGAGAQASCANPALSGSDNIGGAGGGGGGGYGAAGGGGGGGNSDGTPSTGGAGGASTAMPTGPVGGCPGTAGGSGNGIPAGSPGNTSGAGGLGGGALYIAAADRIELGNMAVLTAGGGGGHGGGNPEGGGGGGGSGGMIVLESPHVIGLEARVAANGGGGGEGSQSIGSAGNDGETGSTSTIRALGGSGAVSSGADGGRGGSMEEPAGETVTTVLGGAGGGGGGGVGFIHIVSADIQPGTVSPEAQ